MNITTAKLVGAGLLITISAAVHGCASGEGTQQPWTTKSDSLLGMTSDRPTLHHMDDTLEPSVGSMPAELPADLNAMRSTAVELLVQASQSTNPLLRANAIEALHPAKPEIEAVARQSLADENHAVRFIAAMTVGKLKLTQIAPLLEPLLHDESPSVRAAAIYGMHRCGRNVDLNPLASMLMSESAEVKGNAALILGELGNPSAVPMLRRAADHGMVREVPARRKIVAMQLAEAMAKLGAVDELEVIRAALFAPPEEGELVALACQMCGQLKDGGALPNLLDLATRTGRRQQSAEVRMAAALAVAQIDPSRAPVDVPVEYVNAERFEHRAQAALTLGYSQSREALPYLWRLMNDANPLVQIAAAGGVLRLIGE